MELAAFVLGWVVAMSPPTTTDTARFAWGDVGCGGHALGLEVAAPFVGDKVRYRLSIANRSNERRRVVLFNAVDGLFRSRVMLTSAAKEKVGPAVTVDPPVSSPVTIAVTLAPGEVHVRDGVPLALEGPLAAPAELQLVWGGTPAAPCELRSGRVALAPRR